MIIEQPWDDSRLKITKEDGKVVYIGCVEKQIADFIMECVRQFEENANERGT